MEILICTATRFEEKSCKKAFKRAGVEDLFRVLRTGYGLDRAGRALASHLQYNNKPAIVISTGFAGAISHQIPLYAWITPKHVYSEKGDETRVTSPCYIEEAVKCSIISLPYLFTKDSIGRIPPNLLVKPLAIDMETAALAQVARSNRVPFGILRLITDTPSHPLPKLMYQIWEYHQHSQGRLSNLGSLSSDAIAVVSNPSETWRLLSRLRECSRLLSDGWEKYAPIIAQQNNQHSILFL